ncbi:hypothetical protein VE00_05993 [Pseudogymnoascus sp. WSF 3629]|nr:hypothetical protein VE00_05993 [Pseudogymnoascus sp. WSF 3629]
MPLEPSRLEPTPRRVGRSNRSANSRDARYDCICRDSDNWTTEQISIQDLCYRADPVPEIRVIFLPGVADIESLGVHYQLSSRFRVPHGFWSSVAQNASGFLGCQETTENSEGLGSFSSSFIFLVKEPVKSNPLLSVANNVKISYIWHRMGFYTIWSPFKTLVVLCFGLPLPLKYSLSSLAHLSLDNPLSFHAILTEKVIALYDTSLWSWRNLVRDVEQNRTLPENPQPDYVTMHELARHAIHSSETLAVAIETIASLIQEHEIFFNENASLLVVSITQSKQAMRALRSHIALLRCLYLRSKALEERLRNEINLAFNTVAQHDSRIAVLIGKSTQADSAAVKTISVLGLAFLPGTFICALFSTSFFNFSPGGSADPQHWTISEKFWIYWAVAIPLTVATVACWFMWQRLDSSLR